MVKKEKSNLLTPTVNSSETAIRVLNVIPGHPLGNSMIFARRQIASLEDVGVLSRYFFLTSRVSPAIVTGEAFKLYREIDLFSPDIVHAHFGTMTAFICALVATPPLIITFRGSDLNPCPTMFWPRSALGRFLSQISALRATRIICVSSEIKSRLWWCKSRVTVIPDGVNTHLFYPGSQSDARSILGWLDDDRVVLFSAGREPKVKRLDLALASVDVAKTICPKIRPVILDGSVDPSLIPTYMNGADCLLFTSDVEGSPNVVKEALACGLPVVSVDVGDVRDRLKGVHPSAITDRDPESLGKAICSILMNRIRSNGPSRVEEFAEDVVARRILAVYQNALIERDSTHCRS